MTEREDEDRARRAVKLVVLAGGAGLVAGGLHLGVAGPPRLLRPVTITRTAGVMIATPPPGARGLQAITTTPPPPLFVGDTYQVLVTGDDWVSSRDVTCDARYRLVVEGVATVSSAGVLTAVAPGRTTLVVTYADADSGALHNVSVGVTVAAAPSTLPPVTGLDLDGRFREVVKNQVVQLAVRDARTGRDVTARATFTVTPAEAGTVDATGRLRVLAEGPFTVHAALDGLAARRELYAQPDPRCASGGAP